MAIFFITGLCYFNIQAMCMVTIRTFSIVSELLVNLKLLGCLAFYFICRLAILKFLFGDFIHRRRPSFLYILYSCHTKAWDLLALLPFHVLSVLSTTDVWFDIFSDSLLRVRKKMKKNKPTNISKKKTEDKFNGIPKLF